MKKFKLSLSLVALIVAAFVFGGMTPASAHTDLVSSDPRDGAELAAPPAQVTLVFAEDLLHLHRYQLYWR